MQQWRLQDDDKVQIVPEDELRRRLRRGDVSGTELVRGPEHDGWVLLHDTALFAEEVPFIGDPWSEVRKRKVAGFLWHLATWIAVCGAIGFGTGSGWPTWSWFWFIGVALHGVGVVPAAVEWLQGRPDAIAPPQARASTASSEAASSAAAPSATASSEAASSEDSSASPEPEPAPEPASEFLDAFRGALGALSDEVEASAMTLASAPDFDALHATARELDRKHALLVTLAAPEQAEALRAERDETREHLAAASDDRTAAALERQIRSIDERLRSMDDARDAAGRLYAQQRSLLHEVEGLRIEVLKAAAHADREPPDLAVAVRRLRRETVAAAEVENVLAGHRRGQVSES